MVLCKPINDGLVTHNIVLLSVLLEESIKVVSLLHVFSSNLLGVLVLDLESDQIELVPDNDFLGDTVGESFHGICDTVDDFPCVHVYFLVKSTDQSLLLYKLDSLETVLTEVDGLVETLLSSVGDIGDVDDDFLESGVQELGLGDEFLEIGVPGDDESGDVWHLVLDVAWGGGFAYLSDVGGSLLHSDSSESLLGLPSSSVLFWEVDGELVDDFSGVSLETAEEGAETVYDDESVLLGACEETLERFGDELVAAFVKGGVDGLERLEGNHDLSFSLSVLSENLSCVDQKTVVWDNWVKLESLLGGVDRLNDTLSVDSVLDFLGLSGLFQKLFLDV